MPSTLTTAQLTAALAARQMLDTRRRLGAADAIRLLTPLQGQEPRAPFIGLAARLEGFTRETLESDVHAGRVVKSTINRLTLHLTAADEHRAYATVTLANRVRALANKYPEVDFEAAARDLRLWFAQSPRTNADIRQHVLEHYPQLPPDQWTSILMVRVLLHLVQLPPAGCWEDKRRAEFVVDPTPALDPADAATLVLERYLAAFGPASKRDLASWAGAPQKEFAAGFERLELVQYVDERGTRLFDLPGAPLPDPGPLGVRFLGNWDQAMLAYADRDRILPPEVQPLRLTLSGDRVMTVDGRVAASWTVRHESDVVTVVVTPHVEIPARVRDELHEEAERAARFCEPDAERVVVEVRPAGRVSI